MTSTDDFDFVHDAILVGLKMHNDELRIAIAAEDGQREIKLQSVDRLVAMPFLIGNVIDSARTIRAHPELPKQVEGISDELRKAFFEVYGLTPPVLSTYQGTLFVLASSFGCELLCAFRGAIEVT